MVLDYIKKKLRKWRLKKVFREYGYTINKFDDSKKDVVEYAQWLHPFEGPKTVSDSNINFYKKFANEGDVVIDVGAHTGDTAVPTALAVGAKGLVIALEPNPYVFKILEVNARLNAEGFDKSILRIISQTITEFKPYLLFECYNALTTEGRGELYEVAVENGYEVFYRV